MMRKRKGEAVLLLLPECHLFLRSITMLSDPTTIVF